MNFIHLFEPQMFTKKRCSLIWVHIPLIKILAADVQKILKLNNYQAPFHECINIQKYSAAVSH